MSYEYKVVPAPIRGVKAKGVKTPEDRFAHALQDVMNTLAVDGWDYLRTDTLPSEQREGLMGKTTVFQNMLVFRREKAATPSAAPLRQITAEPEATPAKVAPSLTARPPAPQPTPVVPAVSKSEDPALKKPPAAPVADNPVPEATTSD